MAVGTPAQAGALVISLDFELHWGSRDHVSRTSDSFKELATSRKVGSELAQLFSRRDIHATWATVGFLFASTRAELEAHRPVRIPAYANGALDPYREPVGVDEQDDPEHLAGSLVDELAHLPGQEVASHTFSHYYCLEAGQFEADLAADLAAAQAIAATHGLTLTSLVLPRNQWNPAYADVVRSAGFTSFRGPQPTFGHEARATAEHSRINRLARLADTYAGLTPPPTFAWAERLGRDGLSDLPASAFLRPLSPSRASLEPLQLRRLIRGVRHAARTGRVFHLWWHPHNFARYPEASMTFLERFLDEVDALRVSDGLRSMTMQEADAEVRRVAGA